MVVARCRSRGLVVARCRSRGLVVARWRRKALVVGRCRSRGLVVDRCHSRDWSSGVCGMIYVCPLYDISVVYNLVDVAIEVTTARLVSSGPWTQDTEKHYTAPSVLHEFFQCVRFNSLNPPDISCFSGMRSSRRKGVIA